MKPLGSKLARLSGSQSLEQRLRFVCFATTCINGSNQPAVSKMAQKVYFLADDSGNFEDSDLWVSDGTTAGTKPIGGIADISVPYSATGGVGPEFLTVFGEEMIFAGSDSLNNAETNGLWLTDGTASGTEEVGGPSPGPGKSSPFTNGDPSGLAPSNFTTFGSKAIFTGTDSSGFEGLWVTDGTPGGTLELGGPGNTNIAGSMVGGFSTENFAAFNNSVLFDGDDFNRVQGPLDQRRHHGRHR